MPLSLHVHLSTKLEHAKVLREFDELGKMRYSQSLTETEQVELRFFSFIDHPS